MSTSLKNFGIKFSTNIPVDEFIEKALDITQTKTHLGKVETSLPLQIFQIYFQK